MRFAWFSCLVSAMAVLAADPPTELLIETTFLPEDCTSTAQKGDSLSVHYTGTLFDTGEIFDSSVARDYPLPVTLGAERLIKGWNDGLIGMCVHEKRTLTIPADQAYGDRGFNDGVVPPNAALIFTVELLELTKASTSHEEL
ncbi:hypothetical protein C8J57DRAFT_1042393 [Mycena rebaudengoi]|nr:hypothetical protein C8J57DRAFT_1042393 [Mycena rebaudengoi]